MVKLQDSVSERGVPPKKQNAAVELHFEVRTFVHPQQVEQITQVEVRKGGRLRSEATIHVTSRHPCDIAKHGRHGRAMVFRMAKHAAEEAETADLELHRAGASLQYHARVLIRDRLKQAIALVVLGGPCGTAGNRAAA